MTLAYSWVCADLATTSSTMTHSGPNKATTYMTQSHKTIERILRNLLNEIENEQDKTEQYRAMERLLKFSQTRIEILRGDALQLVEDDD